MGFVYSMSRNSNIWDVFWTDQVQMGYNLVGSWQLPLGSQLMLGIFRFSVLGSCMKHCLHLLLRMAVRQCYGKRRRYQVRAVQMDNVTGLVSIKRIDSPECMDKGVVRSDEGGRRKD